MTPTATLPGLLKDWRGHLHSLVVAVDDVDQFAERIEEIVYRMGRRSMLASTSGG